MWHEFKSGLVLHALEWDKTMLQKPFTKDPPSCLCVTSGLWKRHLTIWHASHASQDAAVRAGRELPSHSAKSNTFKLSAFAVIKRWFCCPFGTDPSDHTPWLSKCFYAHFIQPCSHSSYRELKYWGHNDLAHSTSSSIHQLQGSCLHPQVIVLTQVLLWLHRSYKALP